MMNTVFKSKFTPFILFIAVLVASLIVPHKSYAITNNNASIPGFIRVNHEQPPSICPKDKNTPPNLALGQYDFAQYSWISPKDQPVTVSNIPSITIPYGTNSVNLWMNNLTLVCDSNIDSSGKIIRKTWALTKFNTLSSSIDYGVLSGLTGSNRTLNYSDAYANNLRYITGSWPYYTPYHSDFTVSGLSGLSEGLHTITINAIVRATHKGRVDGKFICVDPDANTRNPLLNIDDSSCPGLPVAYKLIINVEPKPDIRPTGNATVNCTALNITNAEDANAPNNPLPFQVFYQSSGAKIGAGQVDATTNRATFNLAPYNIPFGTKILIVISNYNRDGVIDDTNFKGLWIADVIYSPDASCPNYVIDESPSVELTSNGFEDYESPTQVTFKSGIIAANTYGGGPITVKDVTITCTYSLIRSNGDNENPATWTPKVITGQTITNSNLPIECNSFNLTAVSAGDTICLTVRADPGTGRVDGTGKRLSTAPETPTERQVCKQIVNKPYVSFYGNDVKAGGGFSKDLSIPMCDKQSKIEGFLRQDGTGSGVQFAAFALATINNFASVSLRASPSNPSRPNGLTFANSASSYSSCTPDYFELASSATLVGKPDYTVSKSYKVSSGYTFDDSVTIENTKQIFVYAEGDVTINKNIAMNTGSWSNKKDIPSFYLIVKGNINISKDVVRLDGVYVVQGANNAINTCANVALEDRYKQCNKQLTINGAFISQKVNLQRTYGSLRNAPGDNPNGSDRECANRLNPVIKTKICAAELFKYNPSLFIGLSPDQVNSQQNSQVKYDYSAVLPSVL